MAGSQRVCIIFPNVIEAETDADRLALIAAIVEHDAVFRGRNLFEAEGDRRLAVQPGPPVGIQFGAAAMNLQGVALAFEARVRGVEVEKRAEIGGPARIEPVHHDGNSVKVLGHFGVLSGARWLAPAPTLAGVGPLG